MKTTLAAMLADMLAEMAAQTAEWQRAAGGSITGLLRLAVGDAVALQRGGHHGTRLQLDRERLELDQQKYRDARAAAPTELQKRRDPSLPLSDADRQAIVDKADEILGLR